MTRFTMKLLGALVVVGCGSSAMASPNRGYWTGYDNQHQATPDENPTPDQAQSSQNAQAPDPMDDQDQAVPQSSGSQAQSPQSQNQGQSQNQNPSQGQGQNPSQGQSQNQNPSQDQSQNQPPYQGQSQNQPPYQGQSQNQPPYQGQSQNQSRNPWDDQNQDEDSSETFVWSTGQSHLGVMVMGLTPELRMHFGAPSNRGVLIARVEPNSAASRAGIQVGDILVRVGRTQVRAGDDVVQALAAQGGGRIALSVIRQGQHIRLTAALPGARQTTSGNTSTNPI